MNGDEYARILASAMKEPVSIAFSGGLDSSFLAFLSRDMDIEGIVVGFSGSNDIEWASHAAQVLNIPLKKVIPDVDDVLESTVFLSSLLKTDDLVTLSFELPLFFVARESERPYIMTGQGADELFGGYSRYGKMSDEELQRNMKKDLDALINEGVERERRITSHFGKELVTPYLSDAFLSSMLEFPASERRGDNGKGLLREIALSSGLPEELAMRKKKAAQYGSGIMKVLKKNRDVLKKQ